MRRFLVLQNVYLQSTVNGAGEQFQEPVQDFDTFDEALDWVSTQEKPELFTIEDQFAEEFAEDQDDDYDLLDGDHDYDYYDLRDDRDDFTDANADDDYPPYSGDGDAD